MAQSGDFFIPQQVIDDMRQTEKLPPIRAKQALRQPAEAVNSSKAQATKVGNTKSQQPAYSQTAAKKSSTSDKVKQPIKSASSATDKSTEKPVQTSKPMRAQKPMVPQTGTPAIPVYADNPDNTPEGKKLPQPKRAEKEVEKAAEKTVEKTVTAPEKSVENIAKTNKVTNKTSFLSYNDIIKEYHQDIQKISQNKPVDNERLQKMLEKYHDETIAF